MRLFGYQKVSGTNEKGEYSFYRVYAIEETVEPCTEDKGGHIPFVRFKNGKGYVFPAVSCNNFMECRNSGLKVGSNISFYRDSEFHLCMKLE